MKVTQELEDKKYIIKSFGNIRMGDCFIPVNNFHRGLLNVFIKIGETDPVNAYNLTSDFREHLDQDDNVYIVNTNLLWDFAKIDKEKVNGS